MQVKEEPVDEDLDVVLIDDMDDDLVLFCSLSSYIICFFSFHQSKIRNVKQLIKW